MPTYTTPSATTGAPSITSPDAWKGHRFRSRDTAVAIPMPAPAVTTAPAASRRNRRRLVAWFGDPSSGSLAAPSWSPPSVSGAASPVRYGPEPGAPPRGGRTPTTARSGAWGAGCNAASWAMPVAGGKAARRPAPRSGSVSTGFEVARVLRRCCTSRAVAGRSRGPWRAGPPRDRRAPPGCLGAFHRAGPGVGPRGRSSWRSVCLPGKAPDR